MPPRFETTPACAHAPPLDRSDPLASAFALALGPMVTTGVTRFAYGLVLPAMQTDFGWSYTQAGWMNTAYAIGYLLGALLALRLARSVDPRTAFSTGVILTAMLLIATGVVRGFEWLFALRLASGIAGALALISGGVLAAHVGPRHFASTAIAIYFGGAGLGILLSGATLPWLLDAHDGQDWPLAWLAMGAVALVCAAPCVRASAAIVVPIDRHLAARWCRRPFASSLLAHFLHGTGYIAYMTFVTAWMTSRGSPALDVSVVWAVLGIGIVLSPLLWRLPLRSPSGGAPLAAALLMLSMGAVVPLANGALPAMVSSAAMIGAAVMVPVAWATAFVRRVLPPAAGSSALATYTIAFAAGQCVGPVVSGWIADTTGSISMALAASAAVLAAAALVSLRQKEVPCPDTH